AGIDAEAAEDVLMRPGRIQKGQCFPERFLRLAAIAEHHVKSNLDADALGQERGVANLGRRDLLVDVRQDAVRAGLDAQAQALAARSPHFQEQLFVEHVDARVAAPEEAQVAALNLAAELEYRSEERRVGRECGCRAAP